MEKQKIILPGNIANLSDKFTFRNYVLTDEEMLPLNLSLEQSMIFNGFILGICLKGYAEIKIDYHAYRVEKGSIIAIHPNRIFNIMAYSEDFLIEKLFLSADFILGLPLPKDFDVMKRMIENPVLAIERETMLNMLELHSLIVKYHGMTDKTFRRQMVKALIYSLILQVSEVYATGQKNMSERPLSRKEELTEGFFRLLTEHYIQERNVQFYADKLCLTPKYLSMAVKEVTGRSILNWVNEIIIIEAKTRLKMTTHTVQQISEDLNFPTPSFFGRFFRQHTGITPLHYRTTDING